jgi:universal stress protein E
VDKLTSILVVASRSDADRVLLEKAVRLARDVGAQILLFSCDAALATIVQHAYNSEDAERAWHVSQSEHLAYLRNLRTAVQAPDVQISVAAECYSPLYEGILNKVREIRPDLVMKTASGAHPLRRFTFGPSDWHLMRECPVTLMLVRQHPWSSPTRFAALVDVSEEETARLAETILHTSEHFALGCRGELDVVYSDSSQDSTERDRRTATLRQLAQEYRIPFAHLHVLSGDPDVTLPDFTVRGHYDVLVLGALTHRKGIAPLVGTLTGRLVEALDSDFILVKRPAPREPQRARADVAWQALFGD